MHGQVGPGGLTESSFHVMARTGFGIPDQLNFRNSSVDKKETGKNRVTNSKQTFHCGVTSSTSY